MKSTTPIAFGVACTAAFGVSPFVAGVLTMCFVGVYTLLKLVRYAYGYRGPRVIDPNSPPQRVDRFPPL